MQVLGNSENIFFRSTGFACLCRCRRTAAVFVDTRQIVWYNKTTVNNVIPYIIQVIGGLEMRMIINVLMVIVMVLSLCACSDSASGKVTSSNSGTSAVRASKVGEEETIYNNKMVMTLYDDFDGIFLNRKYWSACPNWERGDRGAKWDRSQVAVKTGHLVLSVSYDSKAGYCKSGGIRSQG